jgi:uncharacterized membrane protein YgcG
VTTAKVAVYLQNVKIIAMKSIFTIAIVSAVVLSSCSTYRQGQTPDDVYYSPAREQSGNGGYVRTDNSRDDGRRYNDYSNSRSGYSAYDDFATMDDRWLMMRVRNPYRWSMFDDYTYYNSFSPIGGYYDPHFGGMGYGGFGGYNPGWSFGLGFGSYSPWSFGGLGMGYGFYNNYYNWNSFYNPYYGGYYPGVVVINNYNGKTNPTGYTTRRNFDLNRYNTNNSSRFGTVRPEYNNTNRIRYNNSNNSTLGGSNRRYSNGNDYYRPSSSDRPVRSYTPSSRSYSPSSGNNSTYSPSSGSSNSGGSGGYSPSSSGGGGGSRPSRR